jgi:hypothetical protein
MEPQEAPQAEMLQPQQETGELEAPAEAAEEGESASPETGEAAAEAKPESRLQKRIDELTAARYEAERQRDRAWEVLYDKEKAAAQMPPAQPEPVPQVQMAAAKPRYEDFETDGEFQEALVEWKAEQIWQRKETQRKADDERQQQRAEGQKHEGWLREARTKFPDFDSVAIRPMHEVPITTPMAEAIKEEALGHEIAYYLGKNPQEAHKIAQLSPISQAREIGKLAVKMEQTKPKPKTQTAAPSPTQPVSGRGSTGKKIEDMSVSEYIEYQNEREFGSARRR